MSKEEYIKSLKGKVPEFEIEFLENKIKNMSDKEFQKYLKEKEKNKIPTVLDDREQWEVVAFA